MLLAGAGSGASPQHRFTQGVAHSWDDGSVGAGGVPAPFSFWGNRAREKRVQFHPHIVQRFTQHTPPGTLTAPRMPERGIISCPVAPLLGRVYQFFELRRQYLW